MMPTGLPNKDSFKKVVVYSLLLNACLLNLQGCAALDSAGQLVSGVTDYFLGGEDNAEPPAELIEYEPEIHAEIVWKESAGEGKGEEKNLNLELAIADEKILVADVEGLVQARDVISGDLIWEFDSDYPFSAGPGISEDVAVIGTSNAEVVALDIDTGEKRWMSIVPSEVLAKPVVSDDEVIIRTADGKLLALEKATGKKIWEYEKNVPALSIRGSGSPALVEEHIIAGYANGKLLSLRLNDGKNVWETSIAIPSGRSEVERLVDLDVDPVESDGVIFISSFQSGTNAVIALDGEVLWRNKDVSSFSGISYDWRYLYVTDPNSNIWQLDQRNGASLWKQDELLNRSLTASAVYDDYVVVADFEGYVHWLSVNDGRQLGRIQVSDTAINTKPVVKDGIVYVYVQDGTVAALKLN